MATILDASNTSNMDGLEISSAIHRANDLLYQKYAVLKENLGHATTSLSTVQPIKQATLLYDTVKDNIKSTQSIPVVGKLDAKRNYILEGVHFATATVISPTRNAFSRLSRMQQYAASVILVCCFWLPVLLLSFTVVPTVIFLTLAFYLVFFNFQLLLDHADDTLLHCLSISSSDIRKQVYETGRTYYQHNAHLFARIPKDKLASLKSVALALYLFACHVVGIAVDMLVAFISLMKRMFSRGTHIETTKTRAYRNHPPTS